MARPYSTRNEVHTISPLRKQQTSSDDDKCAICLEPFQNPQYLPCMHGFCDKPCLERLLQSSIGNSLTCPLCRLQHDIRSFLPERQRPSCAGDETISFSETSETRRERGGIFFVSGPSTWQRGRYSDDFDLSDGYDFVPGTTLNRYARRNDEIISFPDTSVHSERSVDEHNNDIGSTSSRSACEIAEKCAYVLCYSLLVICVIVIALHYCVISIGRIVLGALYWKVDILLFLYQVIKGVIDCLVSLAVCCKKCDKDCWDIMKISLIITTLLLLSIGALYIYGVGDADLFGIEGDNTIFLNISRTYLIVDFIMFFCLIIFACIV